jgi:hypothetical protein
MEEQSVAFDLIGRSYTVVGVGEGCAMLRAVIALLVLLVPSIAQGEGRFALLIGNEPTEARSAGLLTRTTTSPYSKASSRKLASMLSSCETPDLAH